MLCHCHVIITHRAPKWPLRSITKTISLYFGPSLIPPISRHFETFSHKKNNWIPSLSHPWLTPFGAWYSFCTDPKQRPIGCYSYRVLQWWHEYDSDHKFVLLRRIFTGEWSPIRAGGEQRAVLQLCITTKVATNQLNRYGRSVARVKASGLLHRARFLVTGPTCIG